jgi:hypothetical protein
VLFSTNVREDGWDGSYSGEVVQDGVYPWMIVYRERTLEGVAERRLRGHVTLLR